MNILFLSIAGLSDMTETGIYTDLLRQFRDNNHEVYVVCARQKKTGLKTEFSREHDINVLRVRVGNLTKIGIIEKGFSTLNLERQYITAIKKYYDKINFDLIIYSTPPVTFGKVINYIKKKNSNVVTYLLLKDIFPQNAIDLNLFSKRNPIYFYFRQKEKNIYKKSDFIGCMSQANVDYILKYNKYVSPNNIEICPNSITPKKLAVSQVNKRQVREKYGIPINKTIFLYGGNLGKPQGIDFVIECISNNEKSDQSFFLVVGSGTEYKKLENFFKKRKPKNAKLINQLSKSDYIDLASSCDVGLIYLDRRFTIPNFPSRILSYMNSSIPILAATDTSTDIGDIIEEGEFGYWCESGDINKFNTLVERLCNPETNRKMGQNGKKYLEKYYTTKNSYNIILNHFSDKKEKN